MSHTRCMTTQRMAHGVRFSKCPVATCGQTIGTRGLASHLKAHGAAPAAAVAAPAAPATGALTPQVGMRVVATTNASYVGEVTAIDGRDITITFDGGRTERVRLMGFRMGFVAA